MRTSIALLCLLFSACSVISEDGLTLTVPLQARIPVLQTDASEHVRRWEEKVYRQRDQDAGTRLRYRMLQAVCETEEGRDCEVATLPASVPRYLWPYGCIITDDAGLKSWSPPASCTMPLSCEETPAEEMEAFAGALADAQPVELPEGNGCVDIAAWVETIDMPPQTTTLDFSEQFPIEDIDQLKDVRIRALEVEILENSTTFDIPATVHHVGIDVTEDPDATPAELIASGAVVRFGTLPAIPAASTESLPVNLDDAGAETLGDAMRQLRALFVVQSQPVRITTDSALADNCLAANGGACETFPRPEGTVEMALQASLEIDLALQ